MVACLFGISRATHLGPRLRLGLQQDRILDGAARVETFRVTPPDADAQALPGHQPGTVRLLPIPKAPQIDGCYITATGKQQGRAFASDIAQVLFDEKTYSSVNVACILVPGVVFRLWKGSESMDIVLCFHYGQLITGTHDADGTRHEGIYTDMCGTSRARLTRLAKEAFPDDAEIRAL